MNRYESLLNIDYKKHVIVKLIIIMIVFIFFLTLYFSTYDKYQCYAVVENGLLKIDAPINNSDNIKDGLFFKVDNENYEYEIKSVSEIYLNNEEIYQTYYLEDNQIHINNEIIKITIYSNKEKLIKKIIKVIF